MIDRQPTDRPQKDHVDDPIGDTSQVSPSSGQPAAAIRAAARRAGVVKVKPVSLALQGGGSHGAYTWGVLDRLLEEESFGVEAVSGTSAGALNAAALVAGFETDGRAGARRALDQLWQAVMEASRFSPMRRTLLDRLMGGWNMDQSPARMLFDLTSRFVSPYQFNPLNINPLRSVVAEAIDLDAVRRCGAVKLFVSATNVRTGKIKVFENAAITPEALLASACLPYVFQAVEIENEAYWDGGYMGNPAIFPLIYGAETADVVIIQVTPINRPDVPHSATEIWERVNEISFNSSLMREMRAIGFVARLLDENRLDPRRYKRMRMHWIDGEQEMVPLGSFSKMNADRDFILHLRDIGRASADTWLAAHADKIGRESSVDLVEKFL
ncbi:patatin-like phospholipase family protein [Tistrella bauzanensis]|uniref:patatin-like phospholipase family protein n=1 Tax=Tistrella bauzanensis TaxID=657419 RepID=UPI0016662AE4|nr:patatin-like phospholipase family protein [Tistrella bauzanensis]